MLSRTEVLTFEILEFLVCDSPDFNFLLFIMNVIKTLFYFLSKEYKLIRVIAIRSDDFGPSSGQQLKNSGSFEANQVSAIFWLSFEFWSNSLWFHAALIWKDDNLMEQCLESMAGRVRLLFQLFTLVFHDSSDMHDRVHYRAVK